LNRYHVWPDTNTSSHVACLQRSTGRFHLGEMMLHISNAAVLMHSGLRCAASGQLAGCTGTVGILRSRHVVFLQDCTPTLVTSSSQIGNNDGQLNKHKHVILFILFIDVSLYIYSFFLFAKQLFASKIKADADCIASSNRVLPGKRDPFK
jgi:hypothetical protein